MPASTVAPRTLDLADPETMGLARRLYWARFSGRVRAAGIDPEDGFQEIVVGLLTRQAGRSAYDPRRATLSGYLYLAMTGITINMADREARRLRREGRPAGLWEAYNDADRDGDEGPVPPRQRTHRAGTPSVSAVEVRDLATAWGVPVVVVTTIAEGRDPVLAALDAGLGARDAVALGCALGVR